MDSIEHAEYEIKPYGTEFREEVAQLLQQLTAKNSIRNIAYLRWKHEQNPYVPVPLGTVVLHCGQVVGFGAEFALRYLLGRTGETAVLLMPCDAVIHWQHRRRGLSRVMMSSAMRKYAGQYRLFLATTANRYAFQSALKSGFVPIGERASLTWYAPLGLAKWMLDRLTNRPATNLRVRYGHFGDILVSDTAQPAAMAAIVQQQANTPHIRLLQDEAFFAWRYCKPEARYVFYYALARGVPCAYVVIGLQSNGCRGLLLDYSDSGTTRGIAAILRYIIQSQSFDVLSIEECYVNAEMGAILRHFGFRRDALLRWMERRMLGEMALLVRPVRENPDPGDWLIAGLDVRQSESWALKPICSDGV